MSQKIFVYDPTASDKLSAVRGIGRYLQILKENFPEWKFVNNKTIKQLGGDAIFINPFFNFLQPPLAIKRIAKRQIAIIHDLIPLKYPAHFPIGIKGSIYILLNKLALKSYDLIITDSEASKRDIIKILKIKDQKVKIIYPCLPKSFLKINNFDLNKNLKFKIKNYCLYVGDATWNKNLVNIARAIKIANVNCVFVGKVFPTSAVEERSGKTAEVNNGWQRELNEFNKLAKDDKRFIFAGFISDSELSNFYKQASVNLLLSSAEGFGFSYLEAANFSSSSLLSNIPVLKEISDGKALFADPTNPNDIASKINQICFDKNLGNKIGAEAKRRSEFFSADKFRKEIRSVLVSEST